MSLPRSDNEQTNHPKPEFEHYMFFDSGTGAYRDWVDSAEVIANLNLSYRKNKTIRIAGGDYLCGSNGTTFIPKNTPGAGGGGIKVQWTDPATGGEAYMPLAAIGAEPIDGVAVFQTMTPLKRVPEADTPVLNQFKIDTTNHRIYVGNPMGVGEILTVITGAS